MKAVSGMLWPVLIMELKTDRWTDSQANVIYHLNFSEALALHIRHVLCILYTDPKKKHCLVTTTNFLKIWVFNEFKYVSNY